jgi:hypothetical protein
MNRPGVHPKPSRSSHRKLRTRHAIFSALHSTLFLTQENRSELHRLSSLVYSVAEQGRKKGPPIMGLAVRSRGFHSMALLLLLLGLIVAQALVLPALAADRGNYPDGGRKLGCAPNCIAKSKPPRPAP